MSRRRLVGATFAAAGTAALGLAPHARAASTATVWGLDPAGARQGCGCVSCGACRAHATNKMFASAVDADGGRAHPHCKCDVVQLASVDAGVHDALFTVGGRRGSVDRRWQWVQAALVASPTPVPPPVSPSTTPSPSSSAAAPLPASDQMTLPDGEAPLAVRKNGVLGAATGVSTARLRSAWIQRLSPGRRVLFVQLDSATGVEMTITLSRNRKALATRHVSTIRGLHTVRVVVPVGVAHGQADLRVRFRDTTGAVRTATRTMSVPSERAR